MILGSLAVALAVVGATQAIAAQKTTQEETQPAADPTKESAASSNSSTSITYAKVMDAVVKSDGTLVRGKGATGASHLTPTGEYQVDFGRKVSNCAYVATIGDPGTGVAPSGEITVATRSGNPDAVFVETNDSSGNRSDRPFHLQVSC